ncbi:MAG: hypothetical protein RhofKO_35800 [Rhodothermales bacterium]
MTNNQKDGQPTAVFETLDMGVTDALRYLKGGFEAPVREAIAHHVEHDNAAQTELAAARALQMQGHHMMAWHMTDVDAEPALVDEATMAAYLDGALESAETAVVEAQLAGSQTMYRQMAATIWETTTPMPAGLTAPAVAVSAQKRVGESPVASAESQVSWWANAQEWLKTKTEQAWQGPAIGFALGALAMVAVLGGWPQAETLVILPGVAEVVDDMGVMMSGDVEALMPVLELPIGQETTLRWAEVEDATYTVEVMQSNEVVHTETLEAPTWSLSNAKVSTDAPLTVTVQANYASGGVMPVSSVQVVWAK